MAQATNTTLGEIKLAGDLAGSNDALLPQLTATGVTAGGYVFPTMTVDGKGRIISIHSGTDAEVASLIPGAKKTQKGIVKIGDNIEITPSDTAGFYQIEYSPSLVGGNDSGLVHEPCRPYGVTVISNSGSVTFSYVPDIGGDTIAEMISKVNAYISNVGTLALVSGNLRFTPIGNGAGTYITISNDCLFSKIAGAGTITAGYGQDASTIWVKEATASDFGLVKLGNGVAGSSGTISIVTSQLDKATSTTLGLVKTGLPSVSGVDVLDGSISINTEFVNSNLPIASSTVFGAVKTGAGVLSSSGVISVDPTFVAANIPTASITVLGGVKVGTGLSINTGVLSVDAYPVASTTVLGTVKTDASTISNTAGTISIPLATSSTFGVVSAGTNVTISAGVVSVPKATSGTAGIVQVGLGLTVSNGIIAFDTSNLPPATTTSLGVVKIGSGLNVSAGVVSVNYATLPIATSSTLGAVKVGTGFNVDGTGVISLNLASIPSASSSVLGLVKVGSGFTMTSGVLDVDVNALPVATSTTVGLVKVTDVATNPLIVNGAGLLSFDMNRLTVASTGNPGLVKPGTGLSIASGGRLDLNLASIPTASSTVFGLIKVGTGLAISSGVLSVAGAGYALTTGSNTWTGFQQVVPTSYADSGTLAQTLSINLATSNTHLKIINSTLNNSSLAIANPTNMAYGKFSIVVRVNANSTGALSATWGSYFKWSNGTPYATFPNQSGGANTVVAFECLVISTTEILVLNVNRYY